MTRLIAQTLTFSPRNACSRHIWIHICKIFRAQALCSPTDESQCVNRRASSLLAPTFLGQLSIQYTFIRALTWYLRFMLGLSLVPTIASLRGLSPKTRRLGRAFQHTFRTSVRPFQPRHPRLLTLRLCSSHTRMRRARHTAVHFGLPLLSCCLLFLPLLVTLSPGHCLLHAVRIFSTAPSALTRGRWPPACRYAALTLRA